MNEYHINDYHNSEGQHRNYERSIKSIPRNTEPTDDSTYNPLDVATSANADSDRDGAHLVATEMRRRYEKAEKNSLKRKDK